MAKDGFLTPKAISNRIKAKGLQKLRFYCQMCEKQCRDANGFKCHKESESHQRMMLLFAENADKYVHDFSDEFLAGYLDVLRHKFGTTLVKANSVYQEYIKDRHHIHMNSTKWTTLTELVIYLGKQGLCKVEERKDGWFIAYVDQEASKRMQKAKEMEEEKTREAEKEQRRIEKQIKRARKEDRLQEGKEALPTELKRSADSAKIALEMKSAPSVAKGRGAVGNGSLPGKAGFDADSTSLFQQRAPPSSQRTSVSTGGPGERLGQKRGVHTSALDEIREAEERRLVKQGRTDYWLTTGIVVKVMAKEVGDGRYYKQKGEVVEVVDHFVGVVKMIDDDAKLRLDQQFLETVIPKPGGTVKVLNGAYRGSVATVTALNIDQFSVSLEISAGPRRGKTVDNVAYEDVSRMT